jgi:hypothetical protein
MELSIKTKKRAGTDDPQKIGQTSIFGPEPSLMTHAK